VKSARFHGAADRKHIAHVRAPADHKPRAIADLFHAQSATAGLLIVGIHILIWMHVVQVMAIIFN
jgi:hypothetical protein